MLLRKNVLTSFESSLKQGCGVKVGLVSRSHGVVCFREELKSETVLFFSFAGVIFKCIGVGVVFLAVLELESLLFFAT